MYSLIALILIHLAVPWQGGEPAEPSRPASLVLTIRLENEPITPVTARFIHRAIEEAEEQQAQALVILLDTPGGLAESTREIVKDILQSRVPVVVYVAPTGARAASAGVFVALASHIAVMAPGTNIGAAHPVQIGGTPVPAPAQPPRGSPGRSEDSGKPNEGAGPLDDKVVNDAAAWARSLAELRGRNPEWSARAVRDSISASASEALEARVVDLLAGDLTDLLENIDGREVAAAGETVRLDTGAAEIREIEKWWGERLLSTIANPNIAFLLLMLGFYGILFELYTPGWGVGGTIGVVALVLAFFALAVVPINIVGLALILIALALFVAEAFVVSYGALTIGGIVCLVAGGVMLVDAPFGFPRISLSLLVSVAISTAAIAMFLLGKVFGSQRSPVLTGAEAMMGAVGLARQDFRSRAGHYEGSVFLHGEIWQAISPGPVHAKDDVKVTGLDGLTLRVQAVEPPSILAEDYGESTKRIA